MTKPRTWREPEVHIEATATELLLCGPQGKWIMTPGQARLIATALMAGADELDHASRAAKVN